MPHGLNSSFAGQTHSWETGAVIGGKGALAGEQPFLSLDKAISVGVTDRHTTKQGNQKPCNYLASGYLNPIKICKLLKKIYCLE